MGPVYHLYQEAISCYNSGMRIAIVGAGAAGLMAAATIAETSPDAQVTLFERNNGLGKKVLISGGGRCNVTTGLRDVREVLKRYPRGNKFLSSAMRQFPPEAVYDWFEAHGVPLKTEEDLRVFPMSDNGADVVGVFQRVFDASSIDVRLNASITNITREDDQFSITVKGQSEPERFDRLILTTGGQAYRATGSTGDGYAFAQTLGHTITPLFPSLNSFTTQEMWPAAISGLSFERAVITAYVDGKEHAWTGPMLFTHKGITGPAIFAVSSLVASTLYDVTHPLTVTVNVFPDDTNDAIQKRLVTLFANEPRKQLDTVLARLVPKSLANIAIAECRLIPTQHAGEVSHHDAHVLANWLCGIPLHAVGRGAGDEFVTAGGVNTHEVNPSTMESTLCPGLYFAGELLDVDGFTGGFNLQASWATGRLAGMHAAEAYE